MIHDFESLVTLKKNIAHGLFLDTADQTYVVARWCFLNRLFLDFYWNGVHSVEKYCKAALLLNGYSAKFNKAGRPYNHDLAILLAGVADIAHANLPASLCRPASLQGIHWREESLESFVQRLKGLGNPNNRYNLFGFVQLPEDMYKPDQAVLAIRNVALNLNNDKDTGSSTANAQPAPTSRLGRLIGSKGLPEVRRAALQHNLVFAPNDYEHGERPFGWSAANSPLYSLIFERLDQAPSAKDRPAADLADWVIENIHLPKDAERELAEAARRLRQRGPI